MLEQDLTSEQDDRTAVMEDHMKRVQEEIAATQLRVEAKRREIATEEHLKTMTAFQAARLKVHLWQLLPTIKKSFGKKLHLKKVL